jgi:hypothetical protein
MLGISFDLHMPRSYLTKFTSCKILDTELCGREAIQVEEKLFKVLHIKTQAIFIPGSPLADIGPYNTFM